MTDGNNISLLPDTTSPPALPRLLFVRLAVAPPPISPAAGTRRAGGRASGGREPLPAPAETENPAGCVGCSGEVQTSSGVALPLRGGTRKVTLLPNALKSVPEMFFVTAIVSPAHLGLFLDTHTHTHPSSSSHLYFKLVLGERVVV